MISDIFSVAIRQGWRVFNHLESEYTDLLGKTHTFCCPFTVTRFEVWRDAEDAQ